MRIKWKIVPMKCSGPVGYKWLWIKAVGGKVIEKCDTPFDYYYDCLIDAQKNGYHAVETRNAS